MYVFRLLPAVICTVFNHSPFCSRLLVDAQLGCFILPKHTPTKRYKFGVQYHNTLKIDGPSTAHSFSNCALGPIKRVLLRHQSP